MNRTDSHLHLFFPDRFDYDWASTVPALAKAFSIDDYRAAATAPVEETIFVEVDVAARHSQAESAYLCALAEDPANRIAGVVAACRPEHDDFEAYLESTAHPRLVGYRRVLHCMPDELSTGALFRQNVARIGAAGLTFDLCVQAHQHAQAIALIDACPGTRFILDHCGNPPLASGDLTAWEKSLREIARRPNVACKISGIIVNADPHQIRAETFRPAVEHTIASFGWDRVMWGSDWPVCNLTSDLATWTNLLDEILSDCTDDQLASFYQRNARRVYRLKPLS